MGRTITAPLTRRLLIPSTLRSDAADTGSGKITLTATEGLQVGGIRGRAIGSQSGEFIQLYERVNIGGPSGWGASAHNAPSYGLSTHGGAQFNVGNVSGAPLTFNGNAIWHAGNDGSGSGLDADLLDGQHGSYYYSSANPTAYLCEVPEKRYIRFSNSWSNLYLGCHRYYRNYTSKSIRKSGSYSFRWLVYR